MADEFTKYKNKQIKWISKHFPKTFGVICYSAIFFIALHYFTGKYPLELIVMAFDQKENIVYDKYFKNDFLEDGIKKWDGYENLVVVDKKNKIFKPNVTSNFLGGRDIFFPESWSPKFNVRLAFTPQNDRKINLALNYGYLFRFIVGNGDYNQVQLQYNSRFPNQNLGKNDWKEIGEVDQKKWIERNRGLDPKKQIEINMSSWAEQDGNKIMIKVIVTGLLSGESERRDFDFSYRLETKEKGNGYNEKIGIGLLDPTEEGIAIQLNEFELHKL
ncbi:MAG: hypothetical protein Q8L11_00100 [Candidatus Moranbacteria bacterium]|nr:hypothetical protein [Candidatus Moranbacteria bacterium]